jgi:hypothetical protein
MRSESGELLLFSELWAAAYSPLHIFRRKQFRDGELLILKCFLTGDYYFRSKDIDKTPL